MTANEFAYWLQGFSELSEASPTPEQWKSIREHLALVFEKVAPTMQHCQFPTLDQGAGDPIGLRGMKLHLKC